MGAAPIPRNVAALQHRTAQRAQLRHWRRIAATVAYALATVAPIGQPPETPFGGCLFRRYASQPIALHGTFDNQHQLTQHPDQHHAQRNHARN